MTKTQTQKTQAQTQVQISCTQVAMRLLRGCGQQPYALEDGSIVWRDDDGCDRTLTFEVVNDEDVEMPTIKINRDVDAVQVPPEGAALLGRSGWAWVRPEGEWMTATIVDVPRRRSIQRDFNDFVPALEWVMGETDRKPRGLVTSESGGR